MVGFNLALGLCLPSIGPLKCKKPCARLPLCSWDCSPTTSVCSVNNVCLFAQILFLMIILSAFSCCYCHIGVSAVGVALVASAAKSMALKLCTTRLLSLICTAAVVVAYYLPKAYTFPAIISAGGLVTVVVSQYRREPLQSSQVGAPLCFGFMVDDFGFRVWGIADSRLAHV